MDKKQKVVMETENKNAELRNEMKRRQRHMTEAAERIADIVTDFVTVNQFGRADCADAKRALEMAEMLLDVKTQITEE